MRFRRGAAGLAVALMAVTGACSVEEEGSGPDEPAPSGGAAGTGRYTLTEGGEWDPSIVEETPDDLDCGLTADDPSRGVTDDTVRVGGLVTATGPTTSLFTDAEAGARARFERANAEGGVHGRMIEFVGAEDDGLDSATQVNAARRLVADDLFAVVPVVTAVPSFRDTFCDAVMPHFGWGITAAWCDTTVGFAITGCITTTEPRYTGLGNGSVLDVVGEDGTMALLGNDDEAARLGVELLATSFENAGLEVVYAENPLSSTAPVADPSPIVNDVLTADGGEAPDIVYLISDFANTAALTDAFIGADYQGALMNAISYDPRLATSPSFQGSYTTLQWMPFESTDVEFVRQMNEDFDRYIPDVTRGLVAASGYIAADMFLAGLEATGEDLTVDSFLATLNDGWTYSTPDFRGDAHFPANHSAPVPCGVLVRLQDEEYSTTGPLTCSDLHRRE